MKKTDPNATAPAPADTAPRSRDDEIAAFKAGGRKYNANRHLALYLKRRDGRLIWKAFQEYRAARLPIPENILKKLDEWAEALIAATTDEAIGAAIEMSSGKKRGDARERAADAERRRNIVEAYRILTKDLEPPMRPVEACKRVAEQFGTTPGNVKTIESRWRKEVLEPAQSLWSGASSPFQTGGTAKRHLR